PAASADGVCQATVPDVLSSVTGSNSRTAPRRNSRSDVRAAELIVGLGAHVITVTATDAAGNSATCTTTFTVSDTTEPSVSCSVKIGRGSGREGEATVADVLASEKVRESWGGRRAITVSQNAAEG